MLSRHYKTLAAIALVLGLVIIVLSQIKKTVHVTVAVEASHAAFGLEGSVENFLSINNKAAADYALRLSSYGRAGFQVNQVQSAAGDVLAAGPQELVLIPEEGDPTASLGLQGVAIGKIALAPGHRLEINSLPDEPARMRLNLVDYGEAISLVNMSDSIRLSPKRSLLAADESEAEDMHLLMAPGSPITVQPLDNSLSISLRFETAQTLAEDDVMTISQLSFTENKAGVLHSAILGGKVSILETGTTIDFGKNKSLSFAPGDRFDVTELDLSGERIRMVFEGETSNMRLGYAGRRYIPSMLEYLYKNNFLIVLFNSYMVVISLIASLLGGWRKDKEETAKKNKS